MADDKQLDIIRQGVATWNAWRVENPAALPQLYGANLRGANLNRADLREAAFFETVFGDTNLKGVRGLDDCRHHGPSV